MTFDLDDLSDDEIECNCPDAASALRFIAESLPDLVDSNTDERRRHVLMMQALDACLGALHYIGRDDVADDMMDNSLLPQRD